jgi:hypothetical protein
MVCDLGAVEDARHERGLGARVPEDVDKVLGQAGAGVGDDGNADGAAHGEASRLAAGRGGDGRAAGPGGRVLQRADLVRLMAAELEALAWASC